MGQELERVAPQPPAVRAVPIPGMLAELGVRIGREEDSGMQVVLIPPQVRQAVNVINPTTSFAQADPNWTPSISLVTLDKETHAYTVAGKLAFNKTALEVLAQAAGVLYTRTVRMPQHELAEGERFGYRATVGFRRSDGRVDEVTRDRTFVDEAERAEIEDAVTRAKSGDRLRYPAGSDAWHAEVHKRWLNELRFGPAKTETKAINRALRAGLQIPTALPPAAFSKPFLVVGYSFTPNYDDVEVRRMLVAAGLNAHASFYGGGTVAGELEHARDLEPAPLELEAGAEESGDVRPPGVAGDDSADVPAESQPESTSAGGAAGEADAAAGDAEPESPADEPGPDEPEQSDEEAAAAAFAIPGAEVEKAEQVVITFGRWQGRTLGDVAAHERGASWFEWALSQDPERLPQEGLESPLRIVAQARLPEVYAQHAGEA